MVFDYQPILRGDLVELRPLQLSDYEELYQVASDPLIWEQHPVANRHEERVFREFFRDALNCGGYADRWRCTKSATHRFIAFSWL